MQISGLNISGGLQLWPNDPYFPDPYFEYTTLLLPGNGTNNGTNNTFIDGSTNNFTITRNGNTTQGTFSPFSLTGWSNYFDGTGDYLQVAENVAFNVSNQNFTIECWVNFSSVTGEKGIVSYFATDAQSRGWVLRLSNANSPAGLRFVISDNAGGNVILQSAWSPTVGVWYHVAVVRNSTTLTAYINGTSIGSTTINITAAAAVAPLQIGISQTVASSDMNGYISNLRLVKGTALYTANFTPPTAPLTAIANTSLLTCQNNRFIDNSTNNFTITKNGNTSVQSYSPFNPTTLYSTSTVGGSAYFDGSGDYLSIADNAALQMGSGNFTIEFWMQPTNTAVATVFGKGFTGSGAILMQTLATSGRIELWVNGSLVITESSGTYSPNNWYHIAVVRSGTSLVLYRDGISTGSATNSVNLNSTASLGIGGDPTNLSYTFTGYISNFRMVKGSAVYTSAFTPPTSPVTAIANTSLLCNFTNGQITDATSKNNLETVGDAKISTTQSKFGGSSMYFDGTGDSLITPSKLADFGTSNFTVEGWIYVSNSSVPRWIMDSRNTGSDAGFGFFLEDSTGYKLRVYRNGVYLLTSSSNIAINTWYHVAFVRNNSNSFLYIDGTQVASAADTNSYIQSGSFRLGCGWNNQDFYNGFMNDMRVTKGIARYTTNFTPPTKAFPLF